MKFYLSSFHFTCSFLLFNDLSFVHFFYLLHFISPHFTVFQVNGVFSGHTALQAASQNGHMDVVKLLISIHANLEIEVGGYREM